MIKILIVMPTYNAAKTIASVFGRIPSDIYKRLYKIIVVDDGSRDKTNLVLKKLKKRYSKILLITHNVNKGYGATQKTGFNKAVEYGADLAVLLHSDGQYAPEVLDRLIEPIISGNADVVLGSRILGGEALKGGMPLYKYIGNRTLTFIENVAYGTNLSEFHTGYMAYSKKALKEIKFNMLSDTFHFDGEMVMMASKYKLCIKEVPVPTRYADEVSYLKPIKYGFDVLKIIIKNFMGKYDF